MDFVAHAVVFWGSGSDSIRLLWVERVWEVDRKLFCGWLPDKSLLATVDVQPSQVCHPLFPFCRESNEH